MANWRRHGILAHPPRMDESAIHHLIWSPNHRCCFVMCSSPMMTSHGKVKVKSLSHVRLCNPMDCSLPGSSVHGIFQARILEWVTISVSRSSSRLMDWTAVLPHCRQTLYHLSHQGSPVNSSLIHSLSITDMDGFGALFLKLELNELIRLPFTAQSASQYHQQPNNPNIIHRIIKYHLN